MLDSLTRQLEDSRDLEPEQISQAVDGLVSEDFETKTKAGFLIALARKGETVEEIVGFAKNLREKSVSLPRIESDGVTETLDVCGTGGDRQNTFNISTAVALLVAASGVTVAKHGNRAITSRSGSADSLKALGIPIDQSPEESAVMLREHGFAFLFAPRYHPAFKFIGPARQHCAQLKQRTVFNYLGPLLNPARPTAQLIGVPDPELCEPMAQALRSLGIRRGMVVCGRAEDGYMDEISPFAPTSVAEFYQERGFSQSEFDPARLPLGKICQEEIAGGDAEANAQSIRDILEGKDQGAKRRTVLLNAAAALFVAGLERSMIDGYEAAARLIDDGSAARKLEQLRVA